MALPVVALWELGVTGPSVKLPNCGRMALCNLYVDTPEIHRLLFVSTRTNFSSCDGGPHYRDGFTLEHAVHSPVVTGMGEGNVCNPRAGPILGRIGCRGRWYSKGRGAGSRFRSPPDDQGRSAQTGDRNIPNSQGTRGCSRSFRSTNFLNRAGSSYWCPVTDASMWSHASTWTDLPLAETVGCGNLRTPAYGATIILMPLRADSGSTTGISSRRCR
jgi:hypothetical protein